MLSPYRLIYYLGLAVVEATPIALLLTIAGVNAWGALMLVALLGALADWIVLRRLRPSYQRPALVGLGLVSALWVLKGQVAGLNPLVGWGQALGALLDTQSPRSLGNNLALLLGLYVFWRGTWLTQHDSVTLHRVFRLSTVLIMVIVFVRFFIRGPGLALASLATAQVVTFFAVGLLTIALASATEERETELRRMGWRGMATLLGSVALVLLLSILIGALFGREAASLIRLVWGGIILIIALITLPFLNLIIMAIGWLVNLLHMDQLLDQRIQLNPLNDLLKQNTPDAFEGMPAWVGLLMRGFCAIVPLLLVIALFFIARRRKDRATGADEERESLGTWSGLASDLLGLLSKFGGAKRAEGLRDTLARLRGDDPISRIRRSYIKLLLVGEQRSLPRLAQQTPREYTPNASTMLPAAAQPIDTLTAAYERARYHPSATSDADADAADRAWGAIEQADKSKKRA